MTSTPPSPSLLDTEPPKTPTPASVQAATTSMLDQSRVPESLRGLVHPELSPREQPHSHYRQPSDPIFLPEPLHFEPLPCESHDDESVTRSRSSTTELPFGNPRPAPPLQSPPSSEVYSSPPRHHYYTSSNASAPPTAGGSDPIHQSGYFSGGSPPPPLAPQPAYIPRNKQREQRDQVFGELRAEPGEAREAREQPREFREPREVREHREQQEHREPTERENYRNNGGAPQAPLGPSHSHSHSQSQAAQAQAHFAAEQKRNSVVIKVGMVGDAQIGKTSLMVKYVEGSFDEDYIQTLGTLRHVHFEGPSC